MAQTPKGVHVVGKDFNSVTVVLDDALHVGLFWLVRRPVEVAQINRPAISMTRGAAKLLDLAPQNAWSKTP